MRSLPLAVLLLAAACAPTPKFDAARIATVARTALTGLEQAAAAYMASGTTPLAMKEKIATAEAAAEALVAALPTATPENAPAVVSDLSNAVNAVMAALPAGLVPAQTQAAVVAFEIAAQTVVALAAPVQTTATK